MLKDTQAAIDELKKDGPVAIIGFCMGGTIAFLAACKLTCPPRSAIAAGRSPRMPTRKRPPVQTEHFGEKDASIPMTDVEMIKQKRGGDSEIFVYPDAQHGFHCDERGSFHEASAKTAWQRATDSLQ